jgi:hypothetical protein
MSRMTCSQRPSTLAKKHALLAAAGFALALGLAVPPARSAKAPVVFHINSPEMGETVPGPDVEVIFTLENYNVFYDSTTKKGQHIHFILDNQPYVPHYSTEPYLLKNLTPGTHTIRAFPSRAWHESIKDPTAFSMVTFKVQKADGKNSPRPKAPLLTYSRPKGEYAGHAADSILVDYWVKNCKIGPKAYKVRLTVDGQKQILTQWRPLWKTGLSMGEHEFALELLDRRGRLAPGPFNQTRRTITLKPDTTSAGMHH